MVWVAIDKDGSEHIFDTKPWREDGHYMPNGDWDANIVLPKGSIKKLIGRELTWNDEPLSLHDEFYMETSVCKELSETMREFLEKAQNIEDVFHHNSSRTQKLWDAARNYAIEKAEKDISLQLALRLAFQMGAKWADEHTRKSYK